MFVFNACRINNIQGFGLFTLGFA